MDSNEEKILCVAYIQEKKREMKIEAQIKGDFIIEKQLSCRILKNIFHSLLCNSNPTNHYKVDGFSANGEILIKRIVSLF